MDARNHQLALLVSWRTLQYNTFVESTENYALQLKNQVLFLYRILKSLCSTSSSPCGPSSPDVFASHVPVSPCIPGSLYQSPHPCQPCLPTENINETHDTCTNGFVYIYRSKWSSLFKNNFFIGQCSFQGLPWSPLSTWSRMEILWSQSI